MEPGAAPAGAGLRRTGRRLGLFGLYSRSRPYGYREVTTLVGKSRQKKRGKRNFRFPLDCLPEDRGYAFSLELVAKTDARIVVGRLVAPNCLDGRTNLVDDKV